MREGYHNAETEVMILVLYRKVVSIKHIQTKEAQNKPLNDTYQSMITLAKKIDSDND